MTVSQITSGLQNTQSNLANGMTHRLSKKELTKQSA